MSLTCRISVFSSIVLFVTSRALAVQVSLPSTGTDAPGSTLPGGSNDSHYTVTGPGVAVAAPAKVYSPQNVWPQWVPNDAHSAWIGWSDNSTTSPYGNYTFELTFDLTGFVPSTASLSGSWAADQFGS